MTRTDIINNIAVKIAAQKYLEIGVAGGINFEGVICKYKLGVDPDPESRALIIETSDEFFLRNKSKFDIIFIDGLHTSEQVEKDIVNSIDILEAGGFIICHDMNPITEEIQSESYQGGLWSGQGWKAFVKLRSERTDIEAFVVDADYGCGIIRKKQQSPIELNDNLNYQYLDMNREYLLNLKSIDGFHQWLESLN